MWWSALSYWLSQSSTKMPLCTQRRTVLPPSRPSTIASTALNQPRSPSARAAKCRGGSQTVTMEPSALVPPRWSAISMGNSQAALPGPVAIASQTCSGVAGSSTSRRISNSRGILSPPP